MNAHALTTNKFLQFSIQWMSPRIKRMIYLSSLTAVLNDTQELDRQVAIKLNELLHLANTGTSSLKLPVHLSKVIWANRSILEDSIQAIRASFETREINHQQEDYCRNFCQYSCIDKIINFTPEWIKYDTDEKIKSDIASLFCKENQLIKLK